MEEEKKVEQNNENIQNDELLKLKRSNEKKKAVIVVLPFVIILLLILVLLYYFNYKDNGKTGGDKGGVISPTASPEAIPSTAPTPVENVESYNNFDEYIKKLKNSEGVKTVKYDFYDSERPNEYNTSARDNISVIKLSETGIMSIEFSDGKTITLSNVKGAKDFTCVLYDSIVYILTDGGEVYYYSLIEDNYTDVATLIPEIKNADKFVSINYSVEKELYYSTILGVVDKNNNYYELKDITGL